MRKSLAVLTVCSITLIGLLDSCVSFQGRELTPQERNEAEVIGTVTASWTSIQVLHIPPSQKALESKAMTELKKAAAQAGNKGNIDIKNVSVAGSFNLLTFLPLPFPCLGLFGNFQKVVASGDVVEYNSRVGSSQTEQRKASAAAAEASAQIVPKLTRNSSIAVLSISSSNRNLSEWIVEELEFQLVNSGSFKIVDRNSLDKIRQEQNFQMSGDVDDNSAVSIGKMLGATVVITGSVSGAGSTQRLVVKALDVKTAQILTMAREQF